jgi:hypothetical protein
MAVESVLYKSEKVENTDRKFGSDTEYYPIYIKRDNGEIVPALFTIDQIHVAIDRATKNPEDIDEKANWLEKIF